MPVTTNSETLVSKIPKAIRYRYPFPKILHLVVATGNLGEPKNPDEGNSTDARKRKNRRIDLRFILATPDSSDVEVLKKKINQDNKLAN